MASDEVDHREYLRQLSVARVAYFQVIAGKDRSADAQAHKALAELEEKYPGDPVTEAYRGSLELLDAAHSWAVWNLARQTADGLALLDHAVTEAPEEPEVRFIRAATSWHLPGFYHRRAQCEADFAILAGRAEQDAREGQLLPELAAAVYYYWGQILTDRSEDADARIAFQTAIRIAPQSPAGLDCARLLARSR
jgi:hypothetical protein